MRFSKILFAGVCPAALMALVVTPAIAQSTGTQELEIVTVTGTKLKSSFTGLMAAEPVLKQRSAITAEFIQTQTSGQTFFQDLNYLPGVNFTNSDPYGASGGDLRMHGMDGAHISLTLDGMPLNDTGNYAIYTNQMLDPELIGKVSVNQGTTDVDSPTASAVGGTINVLTTPARDTFGASTSVSFASFADQRYLVRVDSGEFGPWGTKAFASFSYQDYDKFRGPGRERRIQGNFGVEQDLGSLGFIKAYGHYNSNRNNQYNNQTFYPTDPSLNTAVYAISQPNIIKSGDSYVSPVDPTKATDGTSAGNPLQGYGWGFDEANACRYTGTGASPLVPVAGTAQTQASGQSAGGSTSSTTGTCTNWYKLRINPSETGNFRVFSLFHLTNDLTLTVDPSFQYTLANGGGVSVIRENDMRLVGSTYNSATYNANAYKTATATKAFGCVANVGCDLNGDGDLLDTIMLYTPNTTNTRRWDINASLIYRLDDNNVFQLAYTLDYGLHRQTAQYARFDVNTGPYDPFAGKIDRDHAVVTADGADMRGRDRKSYAVLNQLSFDYEGTWLDDSLRVTAGGRLPYLHRGMHQYCYLQMTGSFGQTTPGANYQYCTTEPVSTTAAVDGTYSFANVSGAGFTLPGNRNVTYNRFLPNLGVSYSPFGPAHQFFASFAETLSAPKTDNLYNGGSYTDSLKQVHYSTYDSTVMPETAAEYTLGYRYTGETVHASVTGWNMQFKNRIVSSYDPDQGISVDHNIGTVNLAGVDVEADWNPIENLNLYSSVSYEHSRVVRDLALGIISSTSTFYDGVAGTATAGQATSYGNYYYAHTAGKEFVETPDWTLSGRATYKISDFYFGIGAKYVGRRFATDDNGYRVPDYYTVNADASYDLNTFGLENSALKFNVDNLFDKHYFSSVNSSKTCFTPYVASKTTGCTTLPGLYVGAPRTLMVTLKVSY